MKYVVFMWRTIKILISNLPRTRKLSQLLHAGKAVALTFLPIVTRWSRSTSNFCALIGQNLTGESMWKFIQHLESCLLWQLKQSFVSTCDVFNCLFPLDVQNEIQLLSGVSCYSWLVCLLGFRLRNTSLVKVEWHRFRFHLAWCVRGLKCLKRYWPYLIPSRSWISNGKPQQL